MKVLSIITLLAIAVPNVSAKNCRGDLWYCGHTLQDIASDNNYDKQIREALRAAGQPTDTLHMKQSLFRCMSSVDGDVRFLEFCECGCADEGWDRYDECYSCFHERNGL
ncbi:hypothetical protein BDV23DRAFT_146511 [Aspergillus alliaceus]|uniref:Uncharacterized protein n=1 Tax=Petromyces alliaceus TaxID=209559 RepID=A0A5N7CMH3_PETAA|nr:uncharacterized protein BDW43DRAFT_279041 [Aspergillus alliaceus]KAB8232614.1 hypothetical protein BDW43DRAFT_279041 [Aspergillus alliaceus]KAE8394868.1 hypothetical protein BDV23DRAFT_146511 [Aspergillus alliaceus]